MVKPEYELMSPIRTRTAAPAPIPNERELILAALAAWIKQRPDLEYGNYGDPVAYRAELRSITKDLHHARTLLAAVRWRDSITTDKLKAAFSAFSGRLSWEAGWRCNECGDKTFKHDTPPLGVQRICTKCRHGHIEPDGRHRLDYCTGQYWPTEYRRAVCAVLASALWNYWRDNMPKPDKDDPEGRFDRTYGGKSAGDYLRAQARKEFGRGIADRWFN